MYSKRCFKTILKKYPQIEYLTEVNVEKEVKGIKEYAFFDCGIQVQGILEDKDKTKDIYQKIFISVLYGNNVVAKYGQI